MERGFLRTLALIKARSDKLRDPNAQLYTEALADQDTSQEADAEDGSSAAATAKPAAAKASAKPASAAAKPVRLADHMLKRYEQLGEQAFDEEEEEGNDAAGRHRDDDSRRLRIQSTTPDERKALAEFRRAAGRAEAADEAEDEGEDEEEDDEAGGLLQKREASAEELQQREREYLDWVKGKPAPIAHEVWGGRIARCRNLLLIFKIFRRRKSCSRCGDFGPVS